MEIVPRASTREAGSLAIASWEAAPAEVHQEQRCARKGVRRMAEGALRMSPASPANRPLAAKAARVPAAAGTGSLAGREHFGRFVGHRSRSRRPCLGHEPEAEETDRPESEEN